jgi:pyruvate kinase
MLSAETATGDYPVEVVKTMSRLCLGAETNKSIKESQHRMRNIFHSIDETIAMSTMYAANHLEGVKAILCLTESGATALWLSRISSGIPIYVLTRNAATRTRVALFRGCTAIDFDITAVKRKKVNKLAVEKVVDKGFIKEGDLVILTKGDQVGVDGGTNAMKIVNVGSVV